MGIACLPFLRSLSACCTVQLPFSILRLTILIRHSDAATSPGCSRKGHGYVPIISQAADNCGRGRVSALAPHQPIYTLQVLSPITVSPGDHPGLRGSASGLAGEDQIVRLWDMENSREIAVLHGHNDVVLAVTFSPGGELVASTALSDRGVQLWDVQKKECRAVLRGEVATPSPAWPLPGTATLLSPVMNTAS